MLRLYSSQTVFILTIARSRTLRLRLVRKLRQKGEFARSGSASPQLLQMISTTPHQIRKFKPLHTQDGMAFWSAQCSRPAHWIVRACAARSAAFRINHRTRFGSTWLGQAQSTTGLLWHAKRLAWLVFARTLYTGAQFSLPTADRVLTADWPSFVSALSQRRKPFRACCWHAFLSSALPSHFFQTLRTLRRLLLATERSALQATSTSRLCPLALRRLPHFHVHRWHRG